MLPAILLHDTGWSQVPEHLVLSAIAPGGGRPDLVRGARSSGRRDRQGYPRRDGIYDTTDTDEIARIIDGHDSRTTALSVNDALVKDADKVWRLTPHGVTTVMGWFDLLTIKHTGSAATRNVHDHLFHRTGTSYGRVCGYCLHGRFTRAECADSTRLTWCKRLTGRGHGRRFVRTRAVRNL